MVWEPNLEEVEGNPTGVQPAGLQALYPNPPEAGKASQRIFPEPQPAHFV